MARIAYDVGTFGGKLVAEFIDEALTLKNKGRRISELLKSASIDGAATANVEVAGSQGAVFGVAAGQGGNFYNDLSQAAIGIITILNTIPDSKLAELDMGG